MNKKVLCIMGGSGVGKTTLAKNLQAFDPTKFYRVIESTTRPIRSGEVDGDDYEFMTDEAFDEASRNGEFYEKVVHQFAPNRYAARKSSLRDSKWNILVASIEGFLSALRCANELLNESDISTDMILVNIINDDELDIKREGRDPVAEENINKGVLYNLLDEFEFIHYQPTIEGNSNRPTYVRYYELSLKELKKIRNDRALLLEYFDDILEG